MATSDIKPTSSCAENADTEKRAHVIDTTHTDEAMKVLLTYVGNREWDASEEAKVVRKIDLKLMPILCLTYGVQFYDKGLLSQAALFGIRQDLNLTSKDRYSFAASIFYLGFIAGCYPVIVMAQRFPLERVAFAIVSLWGGCMALTAACTDWRGLFVQRFFLGVLEAGVSPMFMMLVGGWYKKDEQAFRMGWWYCFTGFTLLLSPLVNWGLGHASGALASWQYMYLFAGCLTVLWSFCILFFLPPDPIRAHGFTERERFIIVSRMQSNNSGVRNTHFKWNQAIELLVDTKFWTLFVITILTNNTNGLASTYLPIVIAGLGFSPFVSILLLIPIGFSTGAGQLFSTFLASRFPSRRTLLMAVFQLQVMLAALLAWLLPRPSSGGRLFAMFIVWGFSASYAISMGVSIANTAGYTKRSLSSAGLFIAYCLGNFVGPLTFQAKDAPEYKKAFIIVFVFSAAAAALSLVYGWLCIRQNKARDATGTMEGFEHAYEDDLTDQKNPQFRYTT